MSITKTQRRTGNARLARALDDFLAAVAAEAEARRDDDGGDRAYDAIIAAMDRVGEAERVAVAAVRKAARRGPSEYAAVALGGLTFIALPEGQTVEGDPHGRERVGYSLVFDRVALALC